ncbi:MAG: hypothetical protein KGI75_06300 [Rhizobiaceae bacterium]|nr:hypothetical protein [Rhizobiaceae bacterium]
MAFGTIDHRSEFRTLARDIRNDGRDHRGNGRFPLDRLNSRKKIKKFFGAVFPEMARFGRILDVSEAAILCRYGTVLLFSSSTLAQTRFGARSRFETKSLKNKMMRRLLWQSASFRNTQILVEFAEKSAQVFVAF